MIYSQNLIDFKLERVLTALIDDYNAEFDHDKVVEGSTTDALETPTVIVNANDFNEVDSPEGSGNWLGEIEVQVISSAYDQNSQSVDNKVLEEHKNRTGVVRDVLFAEDFITEANDKAREIGEPLSIIEVQSRGVSKGSDGNSFVSFTRLRILAVPDFID